MGNLITTALLGIILSPIVQTYVPEKQVNLREHPEGVLCNCVAYTRLYRPDIPSMDAGAFVVSTTTPTVGAVAKMYYPKSGMWHLAYVEEVGDGYIKIAESNYIACTIGRRVIRVPHDRIVGYF